MAFTLPHTPERILGVALSRGEYDFSDEERDMLEQARPFLIQAYRNAIRYSALLAAPAPDRQRPGGPTLDALAALGLTRRQTEVLQLLATGVSERDIARELGISFRTVEKHLENMYRRLGVHIRAQAAAIAWAALDGGETG